MKIVQFLGESGSGKTTTIELLINHLSGAHIGVIKHVHMEGFDINNKDTARFARAGASTVVAVSPYETVIIKKKNRPDLVELLDKLEGEGIDYLFVEGFKEERERLRKAIRVLCANDEGSALRQIAQFGPVDLLVSYSMKGVKSAGGVDIIHMPEELERLLRFIKQ